jgi:4-hydroxy-tetrahydrodipicolinate synthase
MTHLVVVMGVSGAGKSTVGSLIAERLGLPFRDADDFHPPANVAKMSRGQPLTDEDRAPWLAAIGAHLAAHRGRGCVVTCSALKRAYRDALRQAAPGHALRLPERPGGPRHRAAGGARGPLHAAEPGGEPVRHAGTPRAGGRRDRARRGRAAGCTGGNGHSRAGGTAMSFRGIYPILYAYFAADGRLDEAAMRRQVRCCLAGGAHGLAVLGLATEVNKLSPAEKRDVVRWSAEEITGRVPLAVTVAEATAEDAARFVLDAEELGAAWCILQPPPVRGLPEAEYIAWYGQVAEIVGRRSRIPLGIQNAAAYIGVGLSPGGVAALARSHGNLTLIKAEDSAVEVQHLVEMTGGMTVFNGRAGLELTDCLRAGCAGMIPAPECADVQARVFDRMAAGDEAAAEAEYRRILPMIAFAMQGVAMFLCYGKRMTAWRMGLPEIVERAPSLQPTAFGLACARRFADALGPYPGA